MKKEMIIFILLIIIPLASAIQIDLSKSEYNPREILQAEITGNFISLKIENIFIYLGDKVHPEPVITGLTRQNNKYYYYAILPNQEGDYSLRIENTKYSASGQFTTETISKEFTVIRGNESKLSINPGFVIVDPNDNDFSVKIKSLEGDSQIKASFYQETIDISLFEDFEETLKFSNLDQSGPLIINEYTIPVFIIPRELIEKKFLLQFLPERINGTVKKGDTYAFKIILENVGVTNITDIILETNIDAEISPKEIANLPRQERFIINISIPAAETNISGNITAIIGEEIIYLPVLLEITEEQETVNIEGISITESLSCIDIGNLCLIDEICDRETTSSLEGPCCLGTCTKEEELISGINYPLLIGLGILILVIIIIYIFYRRTKKKPKTTEELLRERAEKFRERMNKPPKEVKRKLERV